MADTLWTAEDLEILKCAIMKKASGQRLLAQDLGGKMEQWADAPLKDLLALRDTMIAEIGEVGDATSGRARVVRSQFSKGL